MKHVLHFFSKGFPQNCNDLVPFALNLHVSIEAASVRACADRKAWLKAVTTQSQLLLTACTMHVSSGLEAGRPVCICMQTLVLTSNKQLCGCCPPH